MDWSREALVARACVDPWALAEQVAGGDPGAVGELAAVFRAAGVAAAATAVAGRGADESLAVAYRNNGLAVFDAVASGAQGRVLLAEDGVLMEEVARVLSAVGETLAATQDAVGREVRGADADIAEIVRRRNGFMLDNAAVLTPEAAEAADRRFFGQAADAVGVRGRAIQRAVDAYDALLANRVGHFREFGYEAPSTPPVKEWTDHVADFGGDVLDGVGNAVSGTVESLAEVNPLRLLQDPGGYGEDLLRYAGGIGRLGEGLVADPLGTLDQVFTGGHVGRGQPGVAVGEGVGGILAGGLFGRLSRLGQLGRLDRAPGDRVGPVRELPEEDRAWLDERLHDLERQNAAAFDGLQRDPDRNGGRPDRQSRDEARVALDLIEAQVLPPDTVRPSESGRGDFYSPSTGTYYELKGVHSDWPPLADQRDRSVPYPHGYLSRSEQFLEVLGNQLARDRTPVLDTRNADQQAIDHLRVELERRGWSDQVLWYP